MSAQEINDYPTDQQMDELLAALEKDDPERIKAVLRKRNQERRYPRESGPDEQHAMRKAEK